MRRAFLVAKLQVQLLGGDVAVAEEQQETKDGLGDDVENTVEDGFRVGMDDITTFAKTPSDGVEEPDLEKSAVES